MKELLKKYDINAPRYTSYPTVPEWNETPKQIDWEKLIVKQVESGDGIALYIHLPFCKKRCWYCGCNSIIKKQTSHADNYLKDLFTEIDLANAAAGTRLPVDQLHFGGGTPNFLDNGQMVKVMDKIEENFDLSETREIAIELDPRLANNYQLELLRKLGFTRVSMGIQDFDADVQAAINRIQPVEMIRNLTEKCRELGFDSINYDLIYGLPKQNLKGFMQTLDHVLDLKPDRIALYSYAHMPQKIAHMSLIKDKDIPQSEDKLSLFLTARDYLAQNGYEAIAMDHFALPEDELAQAAKAGTLHRNFMGYTVQDCKDSLGLGNSSISFMQGTFWQNEHELPDYKELIAQEKLPIKLGKSLNEDDIIRQDLISELMCNLQVVKEKFGKKHSLNFNEYFAEELKDLEQYQEDKLLKLHPDRIEILENGRLLIRIIASAFDSYLKTNQQRQFSKVI